MRLCIKRRNSVRTRTLEISQLNNIKLSPSYVKATINKFDEPSCSAIKSMTLATYHQYFRTFRNLDTVELRLGVRMYLQWATIDRYNSNDCVDVRAHCVQCEKSRKKQPYTSHITLSFLFLFSEPVEANKLLRLYIFILISPTNSCHDCRASNALLMCYSLYHRFFSRVQCG